MNVRGILQGLRLQEKVHLREVIRMKDDQNNALC